MIAVARATALSQLLAVRKGVQADVHSTITGLHRDSQKLPLLSGLTRSYRKIDDADPDLPGEAQRVQVRTDDVLGAVRDAYTRLWDLTATIDVTNCEARGTIRAAGTLERSVEVSGVPVSTLLFLEKQLTNLHTIVEKLPELDPAEDWRWDDNASAWASAKTTTVRSKKVPRNHVLAEATDKHPAQVQVWHEDVPVGYWDTVKFSGAIPADRKRQILARLTEVREAVKMAREEANAVPVQDTNVANALFNYILAV